MILSSPSLLDPRDAPEVEDSTDDEPRATTDDALDKYDLASLACTD